MLQSSFSSLLLLILGNRDCSPKAQLNHYKQIQMIFAKFFTCTIENWLPPILHLWIFSNKHVSCTISWNHFPLSLAVIFPYTGPQRYPMEFLLRVTIIHGKRERAGSSLLSSLVPSLHTFTESLCSKSVTYKLSS